ncbi:MAG: ABC transporter substrate-binding protein [Clostridiales bacterium]|nr:ABC transporter substrate-binding protein [Clostridiales bacterium]
MKKRNILLVIGLVVLSLLVACSGPAESDDVVVDEGNENEQVEDVQLEVLKIGATPVPHGEILEFVKPLLLEEGIDLEVVEFTDYVTPNLALADGSILGNFFQHIPYMESFAEDHGLDLISVANVHIEPIALYSNKINDINELADGSTIAIPNDPSNGGRALILLAHNGLIELDSEAGLNATEKDIVSNPHNYKFAALDAPQLPRSLDDVDAAVINTNYALEANLNPVKDALLLEDADSPYPNILTVLAGSENNPLIQALAKVLNSDEVENFIKEKYDGAIVPAF